MTASLETALFSVLPEETQPGAVSDAVKQLGLASTPTNQQIIDGAKAAYTTYRPAVDAITLALISSVRDSSLSDALLTLDGTNWSSSGLTSALVDPFLKSTHVQTAVGVVRTTDLASFSAGVFTKSLPGGGPGVVGFDADLSDSGVLGFTLQLDIFGAIVDVDRSSNLQYGVWRNAAPQLHDQVIGFYANATIQGLQINLKILLDNALKPYGFLASTGATVPVQSGVFAGTTAQWSS